MTMAMITWKIVNIITLSHYISIEMLCARLRFCFNGVCYQEGIIHHSAVILVIGRCGHYHQKTIFRILNFAKRKSFWKEYIFIWELGMFTETKMKYIYFYFLKMKYIWLWLVTMTFKNIFSFVPHLLLLFERESYIQYLSISIRTTGNEWEPTQK